ncbi:hypothetical protein phiPLPE_80 [Iodobacter phage PhiPLPE]|uniref:Uncharacterized protein n=1 Tax=Iodobacter phage PhiPLPE TaxID=551895 RepID=B5AX99_9CAUD|nr:hypothetical protein phiPLPE_80 [Iodobacter phage PhiPLPE]ACG60402.1 hypothetical protein phiPLPE_80 [Iodobacter phage PhiPLPE]
MKVKIKVPNEAAGMAVFSELKNYGAADTDVLTSIIMEGKKFFIYLDVLISKSALKAYLKTLPYGATVQ